MTDSYTINVPESGQGNGWADWVPLNLSPDQMVTLDLSDLQVVGPTLAARLRALIDRHSAGGGSVEVIPPTRSAVRTYFAAMRLSADLPAVRVWSGMGRFRVEVADGVQVRRRAWPVEDATAGTWVRVALSATSADP